MNDLPVPRFTVWQKRNRARVRRAAYIARRAARAARRGAPFVIGVIAAFLAILLYNALTPGPHQVTTAEVNDAVANALASATPPPSFSSRVYQIIMPSLVLIQADSPSSNGKEQHGLGTGVVVNDNGAILTSLHVVANADAIQLVFADGTHSSGQIVVQQPENDTAVLQADTPPAQIIPAVLGNPNAMNVGDEAYVVGNPFGLYASMSAGVISAFGRTFHVPNSDQELHGLIQIDTAVNPGNSGGPLLNPTDQNVFIGIGFAVPITAAGGGGGSPPL